MGKAHIEPERVYGVDGGRAGWFRLSGDQMVRVERTPQHHVVGLVVADGFETVKRAFASGALHATSVTSINTRSEVDTRRRLPRHIKPSDLALVRFDAEQVSVVWEAGQPEDEIAVTATSWERVERTVRTLGQSAIADRIDEMVEALE